MLRLGWGCLFWMTIVQRPRGQDVRIVGVCICGKDMKILNMFMRLVRLGGLECPDDTGCLTKGERVPLMLEVKFIQWFRNIEHAYEEAKQMESPSLLQDVDRQKRLWMIHRAELESVLRVHNGFDANDCWRIPPPSVPREGWRKHSEVRTKDQMVEWGEEIWGDYRRNNFHNSL